MNKSSVLIIQIFILIFCSSFDRMKCDLFKSKSIQLDGILAAFGDFNSDKYTDIFIINSTRQSFEIQKANDIDHYSFIKQSNLTCSCSKNETIVGLIPSDFHGDAMMDVIVITKFKSDSNFNIYLVKGTRHSLDCKNLENQNILFQSRVQPLLLDYNGDMIGDLLIQAENNTRFICLFENGNFTTVEIFGTEKIRNPNSNAFIDLDNDFIPDLFIESENVYEYVYLKPLSKQSNDPSKEYSRRQFKPDDAVIGSSIFIDYNSDGIIDHLVPVCKNYACSKSGIKVWNQDEIAYVEVASKFVDPMDSKKYLCFVKEFYEQDLIIPMRLRHTDLDGDGYIDLVALMTDCSLPDQEGSIYILKNVPSSFQNFTERTFKAFYKLEPKYKQTEPAPHPILASFLDLAEDGNPDFIVLSKQGNNFIINTIVNENMIDACFFKVLVISGRCYEDCGKSINNDKIKNPFSNTNALGYGTNQAGQTIYFELVDSEGKQRKSCAGQLFQTSDFSLQQPYNIFGLGEFILIIIYYIEALI